MRALARWLAGLALLFGLASLATSARAHAMAESRVWIDLHADGARLTLQLPLDRLAIAVGRPLPADDPQLLAREGEVLTRYLLLHLGARSPDGRGWRLSPPRLRLDGQGAAAELHAEAELHAPPGADLRRWTLICDVITHEIRTHRIQLALRQDWAGGQASLGAGVPLPLGELRHPTGRAELDLPPPRPGAAWRVLFVDGARHIAAGADHLAFVLLLALVAPLQARDGRWAERRTPAGTARHLAGVVSAFTVGHLATLTASVSGAWHLPTAWVEPAVALTVLAAGVHAWRPCWRHDAAVAGAFGLVHGMAFAAGLDGAGLAPAERAQAMLAFNLGIEAAQLALLAAVWPLQQALLRERPHGHERLRRAGAWAGIVAGALWCLQRLGVAGAVSQGMAGLGS